ncbi:MAG: hypothetical protein JWM59_2414 [Verrucomicrobiales bacterium]|nr:hypothetical protein [Verrucomicrobiales bacterium]
MDRRTCAPCWESSGFPRPRGDGPLEPAAQSAFPTFSPPTRGWTGNHAALSFSGGVFPAHAGMDRLPCARPAPPGGFPRPRGDGPVKVNLTLTLHLFSPPTRGWTARRPIQQPPGIVFPAHAGMDRPCGVAESGGDRFPRPRGDGPCAPALKPICPPFSPPTRGWTARGAAAGGRPHVFPAHAGMDRASPALTA